MTEEWRPVPGQPKYHVSSHGRVRSFAWSTDSPRVLKPWFNNAGYPVVRVGGGQRHLVHRLVALVFHGPCPEGREVRHLDGDSTNPRADNLAYGTHSENMFDRQLHGTDHMLNRTHCANGHEFTPENTRIRNGVRHCQACRKAAKAAHYARVKDNKVCCLHCRTTVTVWCWRGHFASHERRGGMNAPLINWDDVAAWGNPATCVHHATTDDLGHGKGSEGVSDQ